MSTAVALLVLFSAFVHALWNALLKRSREPEKAVLGLALVGAAVSALCAVALRAPWPPPRAILAIVASGLLEAGYFVTLARALSRAPLGAVYTVVRGGALLVVWPVSVLVLGERLTAARILGTLLVLLGLASAGSPRGTKGRAMLVAALCACFVGGYHLAYKVALSEGGRPEIVTALSLTIAALVNLGRARAAGVAAALRVARGEPVIVLGGGALSAVGFLAFLWAMQGAGAGLVLTLRNTSILFAQLLALTQGERPSRRGVVGAVLVFAGAVALARS